MVIFHFYHATSMVNCELLIPSRSVYKVVDCVDKKACLAFCKWTSLSKETNAQILSDFLSTMRNNTIQRSENSKECHILDHNLRDDNISIIIKEIVKQYLIIFLSSVWKIKIFTKVFSQDLNNTLCKCILKTQFSLVLFTSQMWLHLF